MSKRLILALDQGTTSSRAIVYDEHGATVAVAQREYPQILPAPGIVEHDPTDIWESQLAVAREALAKADPTAAHIAAVGITNQRETTILWDRRTGEPVANAIVWQSRLTAPLCERHRRDGHEESVREKTGLVLDAYFSATKIEHLLDTIPGLRERAERGDVLFGTVDTYLIWRFSGRHVTDPSNASRTLLLNLGTLEWDDELLRIFRVPRAMMPEIVDSSGEIARIDQKWFGRELPIMGVAGDQQAATFGQACFTVGHLKNTYGTGCFALMNIGDEPIPSKHRLLTTVGWRIAGRTTYCLEGAVFVAGAAMQWLRDGLKLAPDAATLARMAESVPDAQGVMFVPALVGLGAPYWDPHARGTIVGITRGTTAAHFARAAIEAMAYQTCDLIRAMRDDLGREPAVMNVDGGASVNDSLLQFQADLLDLEVSRPQRTESTAWGAATLAGLGVGIWTSLEELARLRTTDREFTPRMNENERRDKLRMWSRAVERARDWTETDEKD